jgi:hypothetical protein
MDGIRIRQVRSTLKRSCISEKNARACLSYHECTYMSIVSRTHVYIKLIQRSIGMKRTHKTIPN